MTATMLHLSTYLPGLATLQRHQAKPLHCPVPRRRSVHITRSEFRRQPASDRRPEVVTESQMYAIR